MTNRSIVEICDQYGNQPDALLEILHGVQHQDGYLSTQALIEIADLVNISKADIHGIVSFYDDFRREPPTGPCVKICGAEACQAVGSDTLAQHAKQTGIEAHTVYCLGNCALGPAIMVDGELFGRVTPDRFDQIVKTVPKTVAKTGVQS